MIILFLIALMQPIFGTSSFLDSRIIGGEVAKLGEVPHVVSLRNTSGIHICGGSLISDVWVLSTVKCAQSTYSIQYGKLNITTENDTESVIRVNHTIVHPEYNPNDTQHDIVLLKLANPIKIDDNVKPANLPPEDEFTWPWSVGTLAGWGRLKVEGEFPKQLQIVNTSVVGWGDCKFNLWKKGNVYQTNICVGGRQEASGQCYADDGGPFTQYGMVVGILSWFVAPPCGARGFPAVYTRVASYRNWIRDNTGI